MMSEEQHNLMTMVINWLDQHGYDGLFHPDGGCGCDKADIMPCGEPSINCEPGYKGKSTDPDYDYMFWREKPK